MEFLIGICDDDTEQIKLIKNYVLEFRDEFVIKIISSTDPLAFFSEIRENKPDIIFLDIDMKKIDGIELGKKIKKKYFKFLKKQFHF